MLRKHINGFLNGDRLLLILPMILSIFGLIMIFNASSVWAQNFFGDSFRYLKLQAIWLIVGIGALIFFSLLDYHILKKYSLHFLIVSAILLILVLVPGIGKVVNGGRRWIQLGFFGFQPAEIAKLALVIYFSALFETENETKNKMFPFLLITATVLGLIMLEPDLGTAIVIFGSVFALYFISGAPLGKIILINGLAIVLGLFLVIFSNYRRQRLLTFFNNSFDPLGASYHIRQTLIALGLGGVWGQGFGQSKQKYLFLPEATTDSIFAVIAEEFGFFGTVSILVIFFLMVYRGIRVALIAKDLYGRLLCSSIIFLIGIQTIINVGANVALFPLTGIPLPFVSYGGSSLVIFLSEIGIIYNISRCLRKK